MAAIMVLALVSCNSAGRIPYVYIEGTVCSEIFSYFSIWGAAIVLIIIFIRLAYADLSYERDLLSEVPHGH